MLYLSTVWLSGIVVVWYKWRTQIGEGPGTFDGPEVGGRGDFLEWTLTTPSEWTTILIKSMYSYVDL